MLVPLLLPHLLGYTISGHAAGTAATSLRSPALRLDAQLDTMSEEDRAEAAVLRERMRTRELAERWLVWSGAIALTDEAGLQPFSVPSGWMGSSSPPPAQAYSQADLEASLETSEPALTALLDAVADRAPSLCQPDCALPLARLAAWTGGKWVRALDDWAGEGAGAPLGEAAALRSLTAHLLETWDVPNALHGALAYEDGPPVSEAAHRIARAFVAVHAAAGSGENSVLKELQARVGPAVSKAAAKEFVKLAAEEGGSSSPLHALRRAQVAALGGEAWVGDAACASRLGGAIGRGEPSEDFALVALDWVVRHQEGFAGPEEATGMLDFLLEMRANDPEYTCVGRTPKTVTVALEAFTASTMPTNRSSNLGDLEDEQFQPNPRGLKGWFELKAAMPAGTRVRVPYEGVYDFADGLEPATIRVAEILSFRRLEYEGEQLWNCLEDSRRSQAKYLSRARARVSSFWSLTKQREGAPVQHLCLIEVWHMGGGRNEIRQAEGPRPRTIPSAEAWYWMERWCDREGVDLSTWDCYS